MKSLYLLVLLSTSILTAQNNVVDTIFVQDSVKNLKFNYKQLIIPTALIGYGLIGIESDQIKNFNSEVQEEVTEHIDDKVTIDDFAQYAPAAAVYALNAFGDKGKNNLRDRSIILASSYLMMSVTVLALKSTTKVERPDGSSNNSFPSGHTATAFAGAEFLWQEYKDKSIWYGISGYLVAAGTGAFRIINNRHWFTDVAAGAGIGILSTKAAYWMYPFLNKKVFTKKEKENKGTTLILPYYNGKELGCNLVIQF
ncbi:phosphatase PAP2 family protein [Flavobacterium sp. A45]|jgi:hypothetical protein|uniref:phosphatase PAP2 family protein n=1 Tax=Flavobacterium sp. A45 TaxID=1945862 RepID=UPI0009871156|nr:phosphatase PAP2 family protein [Flavobacterium sp. A45]OOG69861.1 PA-phosphatase [Flavobacterium sp. A45]